MKSRVSSEWRKNYYLKRISKYKEYLGGVCVKCNSVDDLEFDHKDPKTKSFTISTKYDTSWLKMKLELDKCQLLCSSCHLIKSQSEGDMKAPAKHGSLCMYSHYKCRCDDCKRVWNDYHEELKIRNKKFTNRPVILSGKGLDL